jgi:hypothetical protein
MIWGGVYMYTTMMVSGSDGQSALNLQYGLGFRF